MEGPKLQTRRRQPNVPSPLVETFAKQRQATGTPAHPEPVEGSERVKGAPLIWFDKLTMSGYKDSFRRKPESRGFDLAHPERVEGLSGVEGWFDKLTMSGYKDSFRRKPESRGFDLAHPERVEGLSGVEGWFDKLTMSGYAKVSLVGKGVAQWSPEREIQAGKSG